MRHAPSPERLRAIAAALLLCLPVLAQAQDECACLWQGSFADVQENADVVVAATVSRRKGNAVDIHLSEALRGELYTDSLRVWMQTRDYCRPPAEDFPPGSTWVMALKRIDSIPEDGFNPGTPNLSYGRKGDYYLSSCGGYWLKWQGEAVTGNLVNGPRWAREVEMTPVLLSLLRAFLNSASSAEALAEASREDPTRNELIYDTKAFLRGLADDPDSE